MKKTFKKSILLAFALILSQVVISYADNDDSSQRVIRISGRDRYDTAIKIDRDCFWNEESKSQIAVISNGNDFKESLYGSHLASSIGAHYYPTVKGYISKAILKEIKSNDIKAVLIMGTYKQLSKSVDNTLISHGIKVERIFDGKYMYGIKRPLDDLVSAYIHMTVAEDIPYGDINSCIIINENKYPDVVAAVPFASRLSHKGLHLYSTRYFENIGYNDNGLVRGAHFIIGGFNSVPRKYTTYGDSEIGLNYTNTYGDSNRVWNYSGRLAGRDRYETAVKIAEAYSKVLGINSKIAIIVNGEGYADALSSSLEAVINSSPILLTEKNNLNRYTRDYLINNDIEYVLIIGGENSVSKNTENQIREIISRNWNNDVENDI